MKILDLWRRRGFVGPRYDGVVGRMRFLSHRYLARTEIVLIARRDAERPAVPAAADLRLEWIDSWEQFASHSDEVDAGYHTGYTQSWRGPFEWGERLGLVRAEHGVAGFLWVQSGTEAGRKIPYALLWPGDFRLLRGGVLPAHRARGAFTRFTAMALDQLFAMGARRVFVEVSADNVPSLKAVLRAGFKPLGALRVMGPVLGGGVAWRKFDPALLPALGP